MNRPFPAFAALIALLALAMFAVSSSSRSTTIQSPRVVTARSLPPRGQTNFVLVIPAAAEDALQTAAAPVPSATLHCVVTPTADWEFSRVTRSRLASAQVAVADRIPALEGQTPNLDCSAHYNEGYDAILHGKTWSEGSELAQNPSDRPLTETEVLAIFKDLGCQSASVTDLHVAPLWQQVAQFTHAHFANPLAALRTWIHYYIRSWVHDLGIGKDECSFSSAGIAWNEYGDLMSDALIQGASGESSPAAKAATEEIVRFGGDLWRSAAAAWHRVLGGVHPQSPAGGIVKISPRP